MKTRLHLPALFLALAVFLPVAGRADNLSTRSPFGFSVTVTNAADHSPLLRVDVIIPPECVLYFDRLHFRSTDGTELQPVVMPEPAVETDHVTGKPRKVYLHDFSVALNPADLPDHALTVKFQGCTNAACFFPEQRNFARGPDGSYAEVTASRPTLDTANVTASKIDWAQEFQGFTVRNQQTGYLGVSAFQAFLDRAQAGTGNADPLARFQHMGLAATVLLIILGGFLLNFTPCILPMIPINLAIIGAGSQAGSRFEGFRNGTLYGLGMAIAYGTLGLVVALSGSKFGTLNSSVWFNAAIALIFVVLALGMFNVLHIDFSRFQASGPVGTAGKAGFALHTLVLSMGVMSALLAGACVAPVVISVILLATNLYTAGTLAGLALPFLLGLGMALPWPFAGAGLSFLPKPGKWMTHVKSGFGVVILGFALYYSHLAWHLRESSTAMATVNAPATDPALHLAPETDQDLIAALREARANGRPVFIDFHASWCKDCSAMDATVFNRAEVKDHLQHYVTVRYAAEQPNSAPAKPLLDHFNILGLPTYIVLSPK